MEQVKYFNDDGTETITPLEDVLAVSPPEKDMHPFIALTMILGSMLIAGGTLVSCVWIVMSQLNM